MIEKNKKEKNVNIYEMAGKFGKVVEKIHDHAWVFIPVLVKVSEITIKKVKK